MMWYWCYYTCSTAPVLFGTAAATFNACSHIGFSMIMFAEELAEGLLELFVLSAIDDRVDAAVQEHHHHSEVVETAGKLPENNRRQVVEMPRKLPENNKWGRGVQEVVSCTSRPPNTCQAVSCISGPKIK